MSKANLDSAKKATKEETELLEVLTTVLKES